METLRRLEYGWMSFLSGNFEPDDSPPPQTVVRDASNTGLTGIGKTKADMVPYVGFGSFNTTETHEGKSFLPSVLGGEIIRIDPGGHLTLIGCYINTRIDCDGPNRSVTLIDCTLDAGGMHLGVGYNNLTLIRCNIFNGMQCVNLANDNIIEDCFIHDPYLPPNTEDHVNPLLHGGGGNLIVRRSTLSAPQLDNPLGGGVSTNCSLFPDFAPVHDVVIEDCLIKWTGGGYGVSLGWNPGKNFGSDPLNGENIIFRRNRFERGPSGKNAAFGPVTSWSFKASCTWEDNSYVDGEVIDPV